MNKKRNFILHEDPFLELSLKDEKEMLQWNKKIKDVLNGYSFEKIIESFYERLKVFIDTNDIKK